MPIYSRQNQYRGINAHFQSYAQIERDGWASFHATHIAHLVEEIDRLLPAGYEVLAEKSLHLRLYNPTTGKPVKRLPQPDVTIPRNQLAPAIPPHPQQTQSVFSTPTIVKPLLEGVIEDPEELLNAVVISESTPNGELVPVTRIELLSPSNKEGKDRTRYLGKRDVTLESGTVLVELDYLHHTDVLLYGIAGYASHPEDAYPFSITVSDPRPVIEKGIMQFYGFKVENPIMPIRVPLAHEDSITVDFGAIYNRTFASNSAHAKRANYAREPLAFEVFSHADQLRIWARMLAVLDAIKDGKDLDKAPFELPTDEPSLAYLRDHPYQTACLMLDENTFEAYWLVWHRQGEAHLLGLLPRGSGHLKNIQHGTSQAVAEQYTALKTLYDEHGLVACLAQVRA